MQKKQIYENSGFFSLLQVQMYQSTLLNLNMPKV